MLERAQILWLTGSALAIVGLVGIAFSTPLLSPEWRDIVMYGYGRVCHQLPSRSFHIDGVQVALCHRCVGIYASIPLALLLFAGLIRFDRILGRRPLLYVVLSLIPMAADWGADLVGLWSNTQVSRFATGAIFGIVAGYFLARGIVRASRKKADLDNSEPTARNP